MSPYTPDTDPPESLHPVSQAGKHRRESPIQTHARRLIRPVGGSLVAVAAVAGLISILLAVRGGPTGGTPAVFPAPSKSAPSPSEPPQTPTSAASTPTTPARPALVVLNNSRVPGLADRAAARFRAGGWQVASVGNLRGRIIATTVYYAPGSRAAATALAAQFPSITRVQPRLSGLPAVPLVVVVTRYFTG